MNDTALQKNSLFADMSESEQMQALTALHGHTKKYCKNDSIKKPYEILPFFGIVLSGSVTVCMDDFNGNRMVLSHATTGTGFGEALCFLKKESPVYIFCPEDTEILWLSCDIFRNGDCRYPTLQMRFSQLLCRRTLDMNNRIQVLSKFSIRQKLITLFSQYAEKNGSLTFRIPFDRSSLADFIGTERSALCRELSAMQKDGLIQINGKAITLLQLQNI